MESMRRDKEAAMKNTWEMTEQEMVEEIHRLRTELTVQKTYWEKILEMTRPYAREASEEDLVVPVYGRAVTNVSKATWMLKRSQDDVRDAKQEARFWQGMAKK